MDAPNDNIQQVVQTYFKLNKNARATAKELNLPRTTVRNRLKKARNNPKYKSLFNIAQEFKSDDIDILNQQITELRRQLNNAQKNTVITEQIKKFVLKLKDSDPIYPEWLSNYSGIKNDDIIGVPTLCLSDLHFGEVVDPNQIFGVNEYNIEIAKNRVKIVIDKCIELAFNHIANPKYPGIVVPLLGDMTTGLIHDELKITGEKEVLQVNLELLGVMIEALTRLADAFGKVFVPCVAGNHGRLTLKPRAKGYAWDSMDWMLYQLLAKFLEKDKRIKFLISDGEDAQYKVYDFTYRISHGSQFSGGNGILGAIGPILRGDMKKRSSARSMNSEYDTLLIGHFHQSMTYAQRCICNGSLVGFSEYAAKGNYPFEPPTQNFFITHPVHGITFNLPIRVEDREVNEKKWVSWIE